MHSCVDHWVRRRILIDVRASRAQSLGGRRAFPNCINGTGARWNARSHSPDQHGAGVHLGLIFGWLQSWGGVGPGDRDRALALPAPLAIVRLARGVAVYRYASLAVAMAGAYGLLERVSFE